MAVRLREREHLPTGALVVIDGDTVRRADRRLRLAGLDAPELDQVCTDGAGRPFPCGERARDALRALTHGQEAACGVNGVDRYARGLATCLVGGRDIAARMVSEGWAIAYGRYAQEEAEARAAHLGLWAGTFERPDAWRRAHPRGGPAAPSR